MPKKRKKKVVSIRKIAVKPAEDTIQLLQSGHVPEESKIGQKFRGKNKVIIS